MKSQRVLMALPGLHSVSRGAEAAFEAVGDGLSRMPGFEVFLAGMGSPRPGTGYTFTSLPSLPRERFEHWPKFPPFRNEFRWEELFYALRLAGFLRKHTFDLAVTCSYPFVNWVLRFFCPAARQIFVTQNGDHPASRLNSEYRFFRCDGLVCTNPEFFDRQKNQWKSVLIPNGVNTQKFCPGRGDRGRFGLPQGPLVVMASALIPSKNVADGIRAVAEAGGFALALTGDGPLREEVDALGNELLPGKYFRLQLSLADMPDFYRCGDVFLHMSRVESFGNVYIEAMACGLQVVAHDYSTTRWIFNDSALLVDTSRPGTTAAALQRGLAEGKGPAMQRHQAIASRFDWQVITNAYAGFFRELAGGAK